MLIFTFLSLLLLVYSIKIGIKIYFFYKKTRIYLENLNIPNAFFKPLFFTKLPKIKTIDFYSYQRQK